MGLSKLYFLFTIFLCNDIHDGIALGVFYLSGFQSLLLVYPFYRMLY